jgi:hypothetical protein
VPDHRSALLRDEARAAVMAQPLPDPGDVGSVGGVAGAERRGDHPAYRLAVLWLLGTHLETHASDAVTHG